MRQWISTKKYLAKNTAKIVSLESISQKKNNQKPLN